MKIVELTKDQFESFTNTHPLRSHYQTFYYGQLLSEYYFDYNLIGYVDHNNSIKAASLIVTKRITSIHKYAYAPKGILIDYNDPGLVKSFTRDLKKYLKKKKIFMLKINPDIIIGEARKENGYKTVYNINFDIISMLSGFGYLKLKNNLYFESQFPRFNTIVHLDQYRGLKNLAKNVRNKVNKSERRGLSLQQGTVDDLEKFYEFVKDKRSRGIEYYRDYYNLFNKENQIDLFLIRVDYEKYLTTAQKRYNDELSLNESLNNEMQNNPNDKLLARKMQSDRDLTSYKNDILKASKNIHDENSIVIAGALVIKYFNRAYILISGYDQEFKFLSPNYYLHYKIIEHYKSLNFEFVDLNGMTGDFTKENPYYGLNKFKLGFNDIVYEYIGEFDLVIRKRVYNDLNNSATLAKEFNKPWVKKGDINSEGIHISEQKENQEIEKF